MSFKVLVIAEDPTWNGYILKPLTKALFRIVTHLQGRTSALLAAENR